MAGGFIEGEGSSNYSLEITHDMPDQPATKRGYFIFIQGTPGDFNGNGMHDYCENIIVNATHTGGWVSNPFTGYESYNGADETRQTFELEVGWVCHTYDFFFQDQCPQRPLFATRLRLSGV